LRINRNHFSYSSIGIAIAEQQFQNSLKILRKQILCIDILYNISIEAVTNELEFKCKRAYNAQMSNLNQCAWANKIQEVLTRPTILLQQLMHI